MNRKKKIFQILKKRAKQANAKRAPQSNKPRYIAKADREQMSSDDGTSTSTAESNS